jgi:hypothetical protein
MHDSINASLAVATNAPTFIIQHEWLGRLPSDERRRVEKVGEAMAIIKAARSENAGAAMAAKKFFGVKGFSAANLRWQFRVWKEKGYDDRALVNWAKFPHIRSSVLGLTVSDKPALPVTFIEYLGGKHLANKRCFAQPWRDLIYAWRNSWITDEKIPGYGSSRDYWRARDSRLLSLPTAPPDLPEGWSKGNLQRVVTNWCEITPAETALARRGTTAMREELPTVHNTRDGVPYGHHLFADDRQEDFEILVRGFNPPNQRPLEVGLLDFGSADYGPFVNQPTLPMEDGTKRMLGWDCVKWAFGAWLEEHGLPMDWPVHLHVERGTATVDPDEAKLWHTLTNGIVKVCYTEMQGKYCLAWDEKRVGNFRGKAALESAWSLHHNYSASFPGYIGRGREHCPAQIKGQRNEALALLQESAQLSPAERAQIELPMLSYDEYIQLRMDLVARINNRDDHQLENFQRIKKWRPKGIALPWQTEGALSTYPPHVREFIDWETFLESPRERRERLKAMGRWTPCPPLVLAMIYSARAENLTVLKSTIHVVRGTAHWWFMADSRAQMAAVGIENGKEYKVAFNPFNMSMAHIFTSDGKQYIDSWPLRNQRYGDRAALAKSIAHRIGLQNEVEEKVERLLISSGDIIDVEDRRNRNRQILNSARRAGSEPTDQSPEIEDAQSERPFPGGAVSPISAVRFPISDKLAAALRREQKRQRAAAQKISASAATGTALASHSSSNGVETVRRKGMLGTAVLTAQQTDESSHKEGEPNDGKRCRSRRKDGGGST